MKEGKGIIDQSEKRKSQEKEKECHDEMLTEKKCVWKGTGWWSGDKTAPVPIRNWLLEMPRIDTFGGRVERGGGTPGRVERCRGPPGPPGPPPGALVEERKDRRGMDDHTEWEKVLDTISQERWRHSISQPTTTGDDEETFKDFCQEFQNTC